MDLKERYIATLIGCALGDTLGMPFESWPRARILKHLGRVTQPIDPVILRNANEEIIRKDEFGKVKYYSKDLVKGNYTDDTILTLVLAESLAAEKGFNVFDIAKRQLHEYVIRLREDGTVAGGFGGTTIEGFKRLMQGISPLESGVIGGPGNAPAMKMSPLGLYMEAVDKYDTGLGMAQMVSRITHLDPRSVVSGVVQAQAVYTCLRDRSREEFIDSCYNVCSHREKPLTSEFLVSEQGNLTSRLKWIKDNRDVSVEEAHAFLGSKSEVYSSYPFALFMFQKYWNNPINGLIETVNFGGDCDTTGAMYGALCGAKNGMVFPREWIDVLQDKQRLISAAEGIYALK
ncbi:MAG: ADP-ribosylglycohydrolase family protein [Candidatus Woesearchaeota archaeon]